MAKNDKSAEVKLDTTTADAPSKPATKQAKKSGSGGWGVLIFILLVLAGAGVYAVKMWPQLSGGNAAAAELQQWQTATTAKIRALEEQVNSLNYELIKVKNAAPQAAQAGMSEAEVLALLDAAKQDILAAARTVAPVAEEKAEQAAPVVEEKVVVVEKDKPLAELLLASGAIIVRDMAEQGLPFAYEAEVLQILAQGNPLAEKYVAAAQQYATSGLKGKQALIEEYNRLYASLNDAPLKTEAATVPAPEPQTWQEKIWQSLKKLVVYKKKVKKPEFKAEQDPIYALVNAGKLAEATTQIQTSPAYSVSGSEALHAWVAQVQTYLDFDRAMTGLIMNALANIRLKELQH